MAAIEVDNTREIGTQERPKQRYQVLREAKENKMLLASELAHCKRNELDVNFLKPRLRIEKRNGIYVFNIKPIKYQSNIIENEDPNKINDKNTICNINLNNNSNIEVDKDVKTNMKKTNHVNNSQCQYNKEDFIDKPRKNYKKAGQGDVKKEITKEVKNIKKNMKNMKRIWR